MKKTWRKWTEEEKEIIKANYPILGCAETTKLLPDDHDYESTKRQANKLGLKSGAKKQFHLRHKFLS